MSVVIMSWSDRGIVFFCSFMIAIFFVASMYFSILHNHVNVEPIVSQTSCPETKMSPQGLEYFRPKCMRPWVNRDLPRVSKKFHSLLDRRRLVDETTTRHAPNYTAMSMGIVPEDNRDIATCKTHYMVIHKDNLLHHFPHFANMYLPFFSLLIWQYDVLNISTQSHCLTSLLMDDENDRFWSADRSTHMWMYSLISTVERFLSMRTILSPGCLLNNYPKYTHYKRDNFHAFYSDVTSNYNYFPSMHGFNHGYQGGEFSGQDNVPAKERDDSEDHFNPYAGSIGYFRSLLASPFRRLQSKSMAETNNNLDSIGGKPMKQNYMGSYLHASDGFLLTHLFLKKSHSICELSNQYQYLLNKPMNLLLLGRKKNRDVLNQKEIMQTLIHYIHENRIRNTNIDIFLPNKLNSTTKLVEFTPELTYVNKSLGIYFEDMNFQQQVTNFYQTDILVTMHGAGMTNLIFMKPCSIVIEITPFGFHSDALDEFTMNSDILHYGWQEDYDHTVYKKAFQSRYYCEDVIKEMLMTSVDYQRKYGKNNRKDDGFVANEVNGRLNRIGDVLEEEELANDLMATGGAPPIIHFPHHRNVQEETTNATQTNHKQEAEEAEDDDTKNITESDNTRHRHLRSHSSSSNKQQHQRQKKQTGKDKTKWVLQGRQNRRLTGRVKDIDDSVSSPPSSSSSSSSGSFTKVVNKHSKFLAPGETSNTRPDRLFPEFNAVYSDRCYEDSVCRSCTREVDGVTVSLDKLLHVLEVAMEDRKQCIMRHPFYNHHADGMTTTDSW